MMLHSVHPSLGFSIKTLISRLVSIRPQVLKINVWLIFGLLICLSLHQQSFGQITIEEDFDYGNSAGNLAGQNGGSGFAAAWGGGTGGYIPTGLTFGAMSSPGGAHNSAGFARQITTGFAASGPVSGSFLFQMTSPSPSVQMLGLGTLGSWNNQNHYIGLMPANDGQGGKPALGIRGTGISAMTGGASLTQGTTYMYAFSYDNGSTSAWILSLSQYNNFFNGSTLDQTAMNAAPIGTGPTDITGKATIATSASNLAAMNNIYTYWFGGGSMTIDRIRMSGTAELSGLESALVGSVLHFDGIDDFISIPHSGNIALSSAFTIESWIYQETTSSPYPTIFSKNGDAAVIWINGAGGVLAARLAGVQLDATTVPLNSWSHVALTYDGSVAKLYLNGQLYDTKSVSVPNTNAVPMLIGKWDTNGYRIFKGKIDEFRVWNFARTATEISSNLYSEISTMPVCLIAYYKFNQGVANGNNPGLTVLTDIANAVSENGTLVNFELTGSTSNWTTGSSITEVNSVYNLSTPDINLKGNNINITYGSTSPSLSNHTDFGVVSSGNSLVRTFTIENTGADVLSISSITSSNNKFVVSNVPASVTGGSTQTFTVTFTPTGVGLEKAIITVNNNDCDESAYTFSVHCMTPFTLGFGCISGAIGNYYNGGAGPNVGVVFPNGTASGGELSAASNPIINVPGGFTTAFAVVGNVCIGYNINVYSGLDGTGTQLIAQGNSPGFGSVTFSGIARSVVLSRYSCPGEGYDDITFGSTTIGSAVAESTVEINVTGNGNNILDGSTSTSVSNDTDFGTIAANTSLSKTYTIQNTGPGVLTISSITSNNLKFVVSNIPSSVAGNSTATFTVTFNPIASGIQNATIIINNDDCDEAVYDFAIRGNSYSNYTFNGATNADWATTSNWATGIVPTTALLTSGDVVVIAANCTMNNVASFTFPSGTSLTVNASTTFSVNGTSALTFGSGSVFTAYGSLNLNTVGAANLTLLSGATFTLAASQTMSQGRVVNAGTMDVFGTYNPFYITNNSGGVINVKSGGLYSCQACAQAFSAGGTINNDGTLYFGSGGNAGIINNNISGIITDGAGGAQLTNSGTINNAGTFISRSSTTSGLFTNAGTLDMPSSCYFNVNNGGILNNSGTVNIPASNSISVNAGGTFTNTGTVNNNAILSVSGTFTNNGTYKGSGTYSTSLFTNPSSGIVSPGTSPGCQTYNNGFVTIGTLDIEANGTVPCTQYDKINVTGTATLGGTLNFVVGYMPANGNIITFIAATTVSGTFTTINAPSGWFINYNLPAAGNVSMSYGAVIVPGAALDLSGSNDYISLSGTNTLLDGATQFTIEHWIKSNGTGGIGIVGKGATGCCSNTIHTGLDTGGKFFLKVGGDGLITGTGVVPTGTWVHLAAVYNGSASLPSDRIKIYANGVLQTGMVFGSFIPATAPSPNVPFSIGSALSDGTYNYSGQIDEVRIWNTARSCEEIRQLYNCELTGSESGLEGYYKFNQGVASGNNTTITTLLDAAANGNNGTFSGFAFNGSTSNFVTPGGVTTGTSCLPIVAPEINVQGGTPLTDIIDGDNTPSTTDHTDFEDVAVNSSLVRTFTIQNTGYDDLTISSITSSNNLFTVGPLTPAGQIAGGESATINITFAPTSIGTQNATITINNNDCDEAVYDFAVTGNGSCLAPTITCPIDQSVNTTTGNCSGVSTYNISSTGDPAPVITYAFSGATIGTGSGSGSGSAFNKGITTVTLTATNSCGAPTCSFTVTVTDNEKPQITCAGPVSINTTTGLCTGMTTLIEPSVSDNCPLQLGNALNFDGVNDLINASGLLPTPPSEFTIEFWLKPSALSDFNQEISIGTADNGHWNGFTFHSTAAGAVYVGTNIGNRMTPSYIPSNTVQLNTWHHFAYVYSAGIGNFYKNGILIATKANSAPANFDVLRIGSGCCQPIAGNLDELRIWNAARTQTELLTNMNKELFGTESNLVVYYNFNQGEANGTNTGITTLNDIATSIGSANNGIMTGFALTGTLSNWVPGVPLYSITNDAPSVYPTGNTTVTWTATDASGNTATCPQVITVIDNEEPTLTAPANQSMNTISNTCAANYTIADPITDNCTGATWGYTLSGATTAAVTGIADGSNDLNVSFNRGVTTVTLNGVDAASNAALEKTFTVTVTDTQLPTISCNSNIEVSNDTDACGAVVSFNITSEDNCAGQTVSQLSGLASGANFPIGTTINTFRVTDASNNTATCSFTVSVTDTQMPVVTSIPGSGAAIVGYTCGQVLSFNTDQNSCIAAKTIVKPIWADNCVVSYSTAAANNSVILSDYGGFVSGLFPKGVTTVTFTGTDASNNFNTCSIIIQISDITPPGIIGCPSNISVMAAQNACSAIINWSVPFAFDNCTVSSIVQTSSPTTGLGTGSAFPLGNTTITYTATDASGNTSSCSFTVTVSGTCANLTEFTTAFIVDAASFNVNQSRDAIFTVDNIGSLGNNTPISILINKPSNVFFSINIPAISGVAAVYGGIMTNNSDWNIVDAGFAYICTTKPGVVIEQGQSSLLGVTYSANGPSATSNAQIQVTGQLISNSGGDQNQNNNFVQSSLIIY